jgi:hypothetical protein
MSFCIGTPEKVNNSRVAAPFSRIISLIGKTEVMDGTWLFQKGM